jgi:hypothetical protein
MPIATWDIVRALQQEGFSVVGGKQSRTRIEGKAPFTKHMLRFRRLDDDKKYRVNDTVFEMILKNANEGTSAYDLLGALWRILCLNSLVSQDETIDTVKVYHKGSADSVANQVVEGTYKVLGEAERYLAAPQDWPQYKVAKKEAEVFAKAAHALRFDEETTHVQPEQLLVPRRQEDTAPNLWNVFNVVQENMIKGGITAEWRDDRNHLRRRTTREIKNIDQDMKLNKALFILGNEMAKLKAAA